MIRTLCPAPCSVILLRLLFSSAAMTEIEEPGACTGRSRGADFPYLPRSAQITILLFFVGASVSTHARNRVRTLQAHQLVEALVNRNLHDRCLAQGRHEHCIVIVACFMRCVPVALSL